MKFLTNGKSIFSGYLRTLLIVVVCLMAAPAIASQKTILDASLKATLQTAMLSFIDNASTPDGRFKYIDRQSGALEVIYAGAVHPKIIPVGDDYFLCIEMLNAKGKSQLIDFLVRKGRSGWMVVDVLVNRRDLVKKALASVN